MYLSKFEQLPDEILLEICIYFKPYDAIYSFGQLNYRLEQTISQYRRDADLHHLTLQQFSHWFRYLLPHTTGSIRNLVLSNWNSPGQIYLFNQLTQSYSSLSHLFPNIHQLRLIDFTNQDTAILSKLQRIEKVFIDVDVLIPLKHATHVLLEKSLFLSDNPFEEIRLWGIEGGLRLQQRKSPSVNLALQRLTITVAFAGDVMLLLERAPNLNHFNIEIVQHTISKSEEALTVEILPKYLKFFHLQTTDQYVFSFDQLNTLLNRLPTIEFLSLDMDTNDRHYTDGSRWENMLKTLAKLQFVYFKLRIWFNSEPFSFDEQHILQSFSLINIPICCYRDAKYFHIDTIPYDMSKFDTNMSVTISPNARSAKATHAHLFQQRSKRVQTLIVDGQYELTSINDYLSVIEKFSAIEILQVNAINIDDDGRMDFMDSFRLPNLAYLHYIRSTRCKIHVPFFTFLTTNPIVTPQLKALSIMYGDLIYLRKRLSNCTMDRIKELWLYAGDADGHIVLKDIDLLLKTFPSLGHFFFNHQCSRLIDRHFQAVVEMILSSISTLISFRISCNRGSLTLLEDMEQETCENWIRQICRLNNREQVHVTHTTKMLAIWK